MYMHLFCVHHLTAQPYNIVDTSNAWSDIYKGITLCPQYQPMYGHKHLLVDIT